MVQLRRAVQVLLLTGLVASGAFAVPVPYVIHFTTTSGSPAPTSGSFTYDSAAALGAQFTAFVVVWDGLTFDLTSAANAGGFSLGCGADMLNSAIVNSATAFAILSGTNECHGSPYAIGWDAGHINPGSGFRFSDVAGPPENLIEIVGGNPFSGTGGAAGTFTITVYNPVSVVDFAIIGRGPGETLRLSIVAYKPQPVPPYDPFCTAQIGFANSSGGPVGPTKTVNLGSGQGDYLDYPPSPSGGREEVRPAVTLLQSPGGRTPSCLANAEILDSFSGFSLVLANGSFVTANPEPFFPLLGAAWGQVLRLNLVAWPPNPAAPAICNAQLSFVDRLGNPAGPAPKVVNLSQGHADFLDVAGSRLVSQFGQRAELRPVVTVYPPIPIVPGAAATSACAATAEVYDQFTGRTWAWVDPGPLQ
jgi:hypothetical protein